MQPSNQITQEHHEFVKPDPADPQKPSGYIAKPYVPQEFPKVVGGVTVQNAEEEAAQLAKTGVVLDWEAEMQKRAADAKEAIDFVKSRGYSDMLAADIVAEYGVKHILDSKKVAEEMADEAAANPTPAPSQPGTSSPAPSSPAAAGELQAAGSQAPAAPAAPATPAAQ